MRLKYLILSAAFAVVLSETVAAQNTDKAKAKAKKEELKRYKKMSAEQIMAMKENLDKKTDEVKNCQSELETAKMAAQNLGSQLMVSKNTTDSLLTAVQTLEKDLETSKQELESAAATAAVASAGPLNEKQKNSVYLRIQLGAYKGGSLNNSMMKAGVENEKQDGLNKFVFGYFKSLKEAEKVRQDFVKMGIKDAWIVGYNGSKRIDKEEAEKLMRKK